MTSGTPVSIRQPGPADRQALQDMIGRCSRETVWRRFHGGRRSFPEPYLTDAVGGLNGHFALIAEAAGPSIVALASCVPVVDSTGADTADIAVLVQDSYQRQGIGSTMLRLLVAYADHRGIGVVRAGVLAEQEWIIRLMGGYGHCSATVGLGVIDVTLHREKGLQAWIG